MLVSTFQNKGVHHLVLLLWLGIVVVSCSDSLQPFSVTEPTTFAGRLSCIDCEGNEVQLNLFPDSTFVLHRRSITFDESHGSFGRWMLNSTGRILVLLPSDGSARYFSLANNSRLLALNHEAQPYQTSQPNHLTRASRFTWRDVTVELKGIYTHFADVSSFKESVTRRTFPMKPNEHVVVLERAFLSDDEPTYANINARIVLWQNMEGPERPSLVVTEVPEILGAPPRLSTQPSNGLAKGTWTLVDLPGKAVSLQLAREQPSVTFSVEDSSVRGFSGCNRFHGQAAWDASTVTLGPLASTRMACIPDDALENQFFIALEDAHFWEVTWPMLRFFNADNEEVARFSRQ